MFSTPLTNAKRFWFTWKNRLASRLTKGIFRPHLEHLEERRLLSWIPANDISNDPFIATGLPASHNGLTLHFHPHLTIMVNGQNQEVPAMTGIPVDSSNNPTAFYPIHTHDNTGTLHVESPTTRDFHLKDFFDIWGQPFDQTHILGFHTTAANPVTMTVDGVPSTDYGNLLLKPNQNITITATNAVTTTIDSFFAVGGAPGRVQIRNKADRTLLADFAPYGSSYTGPVSVAIGDVNGDGVPDIITGSADFSAHVKVFNGSAIKNGTSDPNNPDASVIASFMPYEARFHVGVNVAVAMVKGGNSVDIITGASSGNPHVKVYDGSAIAAGNFQSPEAHVLTSFFAYGLNVNLGAFVAGGDVTHSGFADIVTGASTGNPHVKVYNGRDVTQGSFNLNPEAHLRESFFAFGTTLGIGACVACGDTRGSGFSDVIVGASAGNPQVNVYSGQSINNGSFNANSPANSFFAYAQNTGTGVKVGASADFEGNGMADIITGPTSGTPNYRVVHGNATGTLPPVVNSIDNTASTIHGGINVGA